MFPGAEVLRLAPGHERRHSAGGYSGARIAEPELVPVVGAQLDLAAGASRNVYARESRHRALGSGAHAKPVTASGDSLEERLMNLLIEAPSKLVSRRSAAAGSLSPGEVFV